jgi:hypothetical protein
MSGLPSPEICQRILALWIVLGEPDWTETDRLRLINLLTQHGQSVSDLPRIFHAAGVIAAPSRPKDKLYERIWRLFCHLNVDDKPIREEARKKLDEFLNNHKLEWNGANGFTAILVVYWADNNNISAGNAASQTTTDDEQTFTVLDFLLVLFEDYMAMSPNYRMIAALWALHVHHYREFEVTPRLLLVSPGSGYGKTTLLHMLKEFVADPHLTKNTTAPAMYRRLESKPSTCYLLDEAENQGILTDRVMRALLDAGYEGGGSIDRADGEFPVHFPCATAIRGDRHDVPLAHLSRSLTLVMEKGLPNKRFNKTNPGPEFPYARERIEKWNAAVSFNPDPEIPAVLLKDSRIADNCRGLIAIADSFGKEHGRAVRAALVELYADLLNQEPDKRCLNACKAVFDAMDVDRMERKGLAKAVLQEDDYFSDWRGPNDKGIPHELTSGELSRLLKQFGIRARSMRIGKDKHGKDQWGWCYTRTQIDAAWRTHCSENHDTATQTSNVIALARPNPTQT